ATTHCSLHHHTFFKFQNYSLYFKISYTSSFSFQHMSTSIEEKILQRMYHIRLVWKFFMYSVCQMLVVNVLGILTFLNELF
ncbi:hypothetical protein VIGAN_01487300, partial [Vigna angularis var. angularis]